MLRLVVVAHPDDEVLGFGGSGVNYSKNGDKIQPLILCGDVNARSLRPSNKELIKDIYDASEVLGFEKPILGSFPNLKMNIIPHLEIVQFIEKYIIEFMPDFIYTHHPNDLNDDHQIVSRACIAASRIFQRRNQNKRIKGLYYMEILSSTEWALNNAQNNFTPNYFVDIEDSLERKVKALQSYKGVMRESPHPRSIECIEALSIFRGSQSNFKKAEAFQIAFQTD